MSGSKLALVCGDGAIKGGFVAGAVTALQERFPHAMDNVDTVAATSASVGSMFYFLSYGKNHPGKDIWINSLSSKQFIDFKGVNSFYSSKPLYDIDYMVDVVFKKNHPLDVKMILDHKTQYYVPVQNYKTCEIEYFSNRPASSFVRDGKTVAIHDMTSIDIYELIKASNAAPFVFDRTVNLNGTEYIDAASIEPFILNIPELKGKKKIVIITKSKKRLNNSFNYRMFGYLWPIFVAPFKANKFKAEIYYQYARRLPAGVSPAMSIRSGAKCMAFRSIYCRYPYPLDARMAFIS